MRSPNGYGGISNLGGNRRNPFRVRITTGWEYDENTGRQKQQYATLGYYPTRKAAMIALAKYNENPYDLDKNKITFGEMYAKWSAAAYAEIGEVAVRSYSAAFKKLSPLHDRKMRELKKNELQAVMDSLADYSESTQNNAKIVMSGIFGYCMENDLIDKDYSQFVKIKPPKEKEEIHFPFEAEDVKLLWDNLDLPIPLRYSAKDIRDTFPVDIILMMIYTGMRPSELLKLRTENINLEDRYMIGGLKTRAGKERIIPIHEKIYPLIKARYDAAGEWLIPYKSDKPPTLGQYRDYLFDPVMKKLNLDHLPHDGRHTFATFADDYELKEYHIKLIMGHKIDDITKRIYTHPSPADLVEAVNKINFLKKRNTTKNSHSAINLQP